MKTVARQAFWNLPNSLTMARIAVIPLVMVLMVFPGRFMCQVAMWLFIAACITDIVDGFLARRLGLTSTVGAFLDPLADKLLVMAVMVMLIPLDRIPAWMVVLLLSREITITALRGIAVSEGIVIAAGKLGKYKTAFQDTALGFLIFHHAWKGIDAHSVGIVLMWFALGYSLVSGWTYLRGFLRATVTA
ncbi:MAG: CDP-diacylglycerol--glycerol-3-phosphate 3-phosphatidyltransferase [Myxococcota bacterium]|jgi:CDP-diacylglycerol--glycerol-3-phosphate 3-phosphatidyltransferase|nr:CDP-diacylglycerol--glycerol-3-phosphate 3-phosphatidyltransferase [Myxococcota bacterium]